MNEKVILKQSVAVNWIKNSVLGFILAPLSTELFDGISTFLEYLMANPTFEMNSSEIIQPMLGG